MAPKSKTFGTQKLVARKIQLPKRERQVLAFLEPNSCISGIFETNFVTLNGICEPKFAHKLLYF